MRVCPHRLDDIVEADVQLLPISANRSGHIQTQSFGKSKQYSDGILRIHLWDMCNAKVTDDRRSRVEETSAEQRTVLCCPTAARTRGCTTTTIKGGPEVDLTGT